jgi:hypothetical protein
MSDDGISFDFDLEVDAEPPTDVPAGLAGDFDLPFVPDETPQDLDPALLPLAFLLGTWRGVGVGGFPTTESFRFGQEIVFGQSGKPVLSYHSRSWVIDDDGVVIESGAAESGFWRISDQGELEVVLAQAAGLAEVWVGEVTGTRVEMGTDVVARTSSAWEVTAGRRLYGVVDGDLLYAYDLATVGQPLTSHLSARLRRVPDMERPSGASVTGH